MFIPKQSNNQTIKQSHIGLFHLKEFAKKFTNMDPELGAVAFAFVIACIIWASPLFFLRDNVLGKIIMVAAIIALTMYHRIAGIIALIAIIALLNQIPMKEGMVNPLAKAMATTTTPAISFKTPDEFRQKYCVKGYPDDPAQSGKLILNYMLSPAFFTKMDASGNPIMSKDQLDAIGLIDLNSFNKCSPLTLTNGGTEYASIHNMCDPKCGWTMKSTPADTTGDTTGDTTAADTTAAAADTTAAAADTTAEGFTPMLRPHIRTGRRLVTNGLNNLKSSANRLKRQLF